MRAVHYTPAHDPTEAPAAVLCGAKRFEGATSAREHVTCRNCLRHLPPAPVEFTPRYHVNETLKPCPACVADVAAGGDPDSLQCDTCGGVGLVYVTGTPSTENDASPT